MDSDNKDNVPLSKSLPKMPDDGPDDDQMPDGWNQTTNTWVEMPDDGRNYGWRKATNEWVPQEDEYYSEWNSEIGEWVHYWSPSDDEEELDGFNSTTNTWVQKPDNGRNYGWRKATNE